MSAFGAKRQSPSETLCLLLTQSGHRPGRNPASPCSRLRCRASVLIPAGQPTSNLNRPCDAERPFLFQDTGRISTIVGAGDWEWT